MGRSPQVTGYGLEELGIPLTPRKTIETNAYLQTLYPIASRGRWCLAGRWAWRWKDRIDRAFVRQFHS